MRDIIILEKNGKTEVTATMKIWLHSDDPKKTIEILENAKFDGLVSSKSGSMIGAFINVFRTMAMMDNNEVYNTDIISDFDDYIKQKRDSLRLRIPIRRIIDTKNDIVKQQNSLNKTCCKKYKNTTDETSDSTQEVFASKVDALSTLYKELKRAERCYGKYTHLLNILRDIKTDAYISDDERYVIDTKIKIYEDKVSELKTVHEKLIMAISDI